MSKNIKYELRANALKVSLALHGRQKFIKDVIISYRAGFNAEYLKHLKQIKKYQDNQENKFGSDKTKEWRWGVSIPNRLFYFLDKMLQPPLNKNFLKDKKELRWLMNEFPEFRIPEKL